MGERMKVLIAHDGLNDGQAVLAELRLAGLPRNVEALIVASADVELPPVPAGETMPTSPDEHLAAHLKARAEAAYNVAIKERERALLSVYDALNMARQAGERIQSAFPDWQVNAEAYPESLAVAVLDRARDWGANLIIVEAGEDGSPLSKIVNEAACSVRVARARRRADDSAPRLIIGVDGSPFAEKAVRAVAEREWPAGTEVLLVTASRSSGLSIGASDRQHEDAAEMQQAARAMLSEAGLNVNAITREGDARNVLIEEAETWKADSIFVGSRGLDSALKRFLSGSVSTAVTANANCSVEVVR